MGFGDLGNLILIVFIFTLLQLFLSLNIGISEIRNNWHKYKCNPGIMPFAHVFGHDTGKNFNECIKLSQANFMSSFLEPIYTGLGFFAETGSVFTEVFEELKIFGNAQNSSSGSLVSNIKNRLLAMGFETNQIYINISNTFGQLSSLITVVFYLVETGLTAGEFAWQELPGTFIRFAL